MASEHIWKDVLLFIFDEGGRATLSSLAKEFKIKRSQASSVLFGLRKKGYTVNIRGGNISITEFGKDKLVEIFPSVMHRLFGEPKEIGYEVEEFTIAKAKSFLEPPSKIWGRSVEVNDEDQSLRFSKTEKKLDTPLESETFWRDEYISLVNKMVEKL